MMFTALPCCAHSAGMNGAAGWIVRAATPPSPSQPVMVFDTSLAMAEAAQLGAGVAIAPVCMFSRLLQSGALVTVCRRNHPRRLLADAVTVPYGNPGHAAIRPLAAEYGGGVKLTHLRAFYPQIITFTDAQPFTAAVRTASGVLHDFGLGCNPSTMPVPG